jgi:hypothetical protein
MGKSRVCRLPLSEFERRKLGWRRGTNLNLR